MKILNNSPLSFQKKLLAKYDVLNFRIYELERQKDQDYFKRVIADKNWEGNFYADDCDYFINNLATNNAKIYALEDKDDNCLSYSLVYKYSNSDCLSLLEARPSSRYGKNKKRVKYTGETMVAFLIEMAKAFNKPYFIVDRPLEDAISFYEKCCFKMSAESTEKMIMRYKEYDDFIMQNESHVGKAQIFSEVKNEDIE